MKQSTLILVVAASVTAVVLRLADLPMENFSAMAALAVLCGAVVRPVYVGLLIPLACRAVTDCVLEYRTGHGFYDSMVFEYVAYGVSGVIGMTLQPRNMPTALAGGIAAAMTFFLISNFGVWCMPHGGSYLYPRTMAGLWECYVQGLPFAKGTCLGEIPFTVGFFGALRLLGLPTARTSTSVASSEHPSTADV